MIFSGFGLTCSLKLLVGLFSGLEKSVKDLHRQTVALERFRMILNEEVDKTYKRMKSVFDEMRTR
jgi:hypothetical protein